MTPARALLHQSVMPTALPPTADVPTWGWAALGVVVLTLVAVDLVTHRRNHQSSRRAAWVWTGVWVATALVFNVFVGVWLGAEAAEQFLGAYVLEKSLSVDNLFLFLVIFGALQIPREEQHRVLTWGILGALITRGCFIALGAAAIQRWHAIIYVFAAFLLFTAIKLLRQPSETPKRRLLIWLERHVRWTQQLHGHHFFARLDGRWVATPLLLALIAIELTDVIFAVDSVPAAFAVTTDPFIVYSSNVFAVLGLRALYTVLAGSLENIRYLRYGLAAVLAFAGIKMLMSNWVTIHPLAAVAVIIGCIGTAVVASVRANRRDAVSSR